MSAYVYNYKLYYVQPYQTCRLFSPCLGLFTPRSVDGSPIQNGSICALPSRIGRTQLRAVQQLSEGPYVETETYPKDGDGTRGVSSTGLAVIWGWVKTYFYHIFHQPTILSTWKLFRLRNQWGICF